MPRYHRHMFCGREGPQHGLHFNPAYRYAGPEVLRVTLCRYAITLICAPAFDFLFKQSCSRMTLSLRASGDIDICSACGAEHPRLGCGRVRGRASIPITARRATWTGPWDR